MRRTQVWREDGRVLLTTTVVERDDAPALSDAVTSATSPMPCASTSGITTRTVHIGESRTPGPAPAADPISKPATITRLTIRRRDRLGGLLHEYEHAA